MTHPGKERRASPVVNGWGGLQYLRYPGLEGRFQDAGDAQAPVLHEDTSARIGKAPHGVERQIRKQRSDNNQGIDWISADINDYDGSMWNGNVGVNFQAFKHFGIDLSYQYFNIDLNVTRESWRGGVEMSYSGPVIALTANW